MAGLVITGIILASAIFAPLLTPYNPIAQNLNATLQGPSAQHWLGTDQLGRDVFTRLLYGARVDLRVGFIAVLFPFCLGTILGSLAGYFGGWTELVIMRLVDVVVAFPFYVLLIALVFVLGPASGASTSRSRSSAGSPTPGWCGPRSWWPSGRTTCWPRRAAAVQPAHHGPSPDPQRDQPGDHLRDVRHRAGHPRDRHSRLLRPRHPAATAEWGSMINEGQNFLTTHWQLVIIPGFAVVVVGLGLSLIGDGLADLLRPGQS